MKEVPDLRLRPIEQRAQPGVLVCDTVFSGTYKSLADMEKASYDAKQTPESRQSRARYNIPEPAEPQITFVRERFDRISRFETFEKPTDSSDVSNRFVSQAEAKAKKVYEKMADKGQMDRSLVGAAIGTRLERSKRVVTRFVDRATQMIKDGETDGLTVKSFFGRIEDFKKGDSTRGYNSLVHKKDEPEPDEQTRSRYSKMVESVLAGSADVQIQKDGAPFKHVNGQRKLDVGLPTNDRYYISPLLNGQPDKVLKIWTDTLVDLGLDEKLYYKVNTGLASRYDIIIAYASSETDAEIQQAMQEFSRRCPQELMSDTVLPSGVEVAKGVAYAPEPAELNKLLEYCGIDGGGNTEVTLSYNELATGLTELALQRGAYELKKQGVDSALLTPRALSDAARPFFAQYLKLSGIDPTTMRQLPTV